MNSYSTPRIIKKISLGSVIVLTVRFFQTVDFNLKRINLEAKRKAKIFELEKRQDMPMAQDRVYFN